MQSLNCFKGIFTEENECLNDNGGCEGLCVNTVGGYYCTCKDGLKLEPVEAVNCDGRNDVIYIISGFRL